MARGGARRNAGRPRKYSTRDFFGASKPAETEAAVAQYDSAAEYLDAVARGIEAPNQARIAAAKALLPYEKPKTRVPLSATDKPRKMQEQQRQNDEVNEQAEWQRRAAEIRAKHGRPN